MSKLKRLEAVRRYDQAISESQAPLARIVRLAALSLSTPIALLSIVGNDRIEFRVRYGLELPGMNREPGLCDACVASQRVWIVRSPRENQQAAANALMAGPLGLQSYLGAPLQTPDGLTIGTLCVLDRMPRDPSQMEIECLSALAGVAMDQLHLQLAVQLLRAEHALELARVDQREERIVALNREVAHRSKNLLAVVQAIVRQSAGPTSVDVYSVRLLNRVDALARTQDLLLAEQWQGVTLHDLVDRQLEPFVDNSERVHVDGPHIVLRPSAAQSIGLALHELAANSVTHGILARVEGTISVSWIIRPHSGGPQLTLRWHEVDGGSEMKVASGFGRLVLERLTSQALSGHAQLTIGASSVEWTLACPAGAAADNKSGTV